jgi:mannose-1-phosphate guanylyltransferase
MTQQIQPIILCGGAGSRLWPESRGQRAKQFLTLAGTSSLLQQSVARIQSAAFAPPMIICGPDHVAPIQDQLRGHDYVLMVEPAARGTAGAIALATAHHLPSDASDPSNSPLLLVMPSDHIITNVPAFHRAVADAAPLAQQGWIVTFGISPHAPETGFGYIAAGEPISDTGFAVTRFIEKPCQQDAEAMLAAGGYSWNAGIFLFRADRMAQAMSQHCPAIYHAADHAVRSAQYDAQSILANAAAFAAAPSDSIDYAVMEQDSRVAVVPVDMGWSDIGSWSAVHALANKDADNNAVSGQAWLHASQGNLVRSGGKRVSLIGVEGLAVVVDGDDILILSMDRSQNVRLAAQQDASGD